MGGRRGMQWVIAATVLLSMVATGRIVGTAAVTPGKSVMETAGSTSDRDAQADPRTRPAEHARQAQAGEVRARFDQAVTMLHARQYDHAATALHRVLELAPRMPEAHVNMGYAMLGLGRSEAARDFFQGAIELKPQQANAYYGLALALEAAHDLEGALGAMRSYLHLSKASDPYRAKARSALWEWEAALGRPTAPQQVPLAENVRSATGAKP